VQAVARDQTGAVYPTLSAASTHPVNPPFGG